MTIIRLAPALLALALATGNALAVDGSWSSTGSGNWNDATKWLTSPTGQIPGGAGSTVSVTNSASASGSRNFTLDISPVVGIFNVGLSTNKSSNFNAATNQTLTFDNSGSAAQLNMPTTASNSAYFNMPVLLNGSLNISNLKTADSGKHIDIQPSSSITNISNVDVTITNIGGGKMNIWGNVNDGPNGKISIVQDNNAIVTYALTMASPNPTYSGSTTIKSGFLDLQNANAIQNSTLIMNGGNLQMNSLGGTSFNFGGLSASTSGTGYDIALSNTAAAAVALSVGNNNANTTYAGALSAGGSLNKIGTGTLSLTNTNTYNGNTTITAGTLKLGSAGSITNSALLSIAAGGTYDVSAISSYTLSSSTALSASGTGTGAGTQATIIGGTTVSLGSQGITLTWGSGTSGIDSTHPCLVVSQGALTLNNNALTINGSLLGNGTYTLISVTGGTINQNVSPSYAVSGTALDGTKTNVVSVSGGSVILTVTAGSSSETITATPTTLPASLTTTYGTASPAQSVSVTGTGLTASITATAQTGFQVSSDDSTYGSTATLSLSGGPLYVRLAATAPAAGSYSAVTAAILSSGSATPVNVTTTASGNTVSKASPTVTVTVGTYTYNGSAQGPNTYTTGPTGDTGAPTWSYAGTGLTSYAASPTPPTVPGTYSATVSLAVDSNFNAASSSATAFTISGGTITVTGSLTPFTTTVGTASPAQSVSVSGASLTGNILATAPTSFEVSTDGSTYFPTVTYTQSGGNASGTLFVRLAATAPVAAYSGNVVLTSAVSPAVNIAVTGTVNPNPGDGYWILNGDGVWSTTSNWASGAIADAVGGTAHFTTAFTSNRTVTLDSNRTLGILNLSVSGRTLTIDPSGGVVLTMDNTGSTAAQINMTSAQNMVVSVPIALNDSLVVNQNISNGTGKDLQLAAISSTNGSLTIEHKSTFADGQTRFAGMISDGTAGNTISFTQTSGRSKFYAANSYTGATTLNGGSLKLDVGGSLAAGTSVSIAAGATLDLTESTAASATYTWNTTSLSASGTTTPATITGTALGTIDMGVKPISLTWAGASSGTDTTHPSLTVTGANLSLGGNPFTVVVPGTALGVGVYTLVSAASITGGSTVNPTALYTGGNGLVGGTTGVVSISGNTVILTVTTGATYAGWASAQIPVVTGPPSADSDNDGVSNGTEYFMKAPAGFTANPALNGSNTITWTNGGNIPPSAYGAQYVVQTSNDLVTWADVPVGSLTANTPGPGGSLTYTLTGTAPRFVRLKVAPN